MLVAIGLYIRLKIMETPVFTRLVQQKRVERRPMLEVLKRQPREVLLSALARMAEQAPFYIFTAFIFSYATGNLDVKRDFLLAAVMCASLVSFFTIPIFGHLSDRMGRRRIYLVGAIVTGIFGFAYFGMLNSGSAAWIFVAVILSLVPHDMMYGPQAALIAEAFTPRLRYSGASMGYQLASIIAGGPAPLIAAALFAHYKTGYAVAFYILACAICSVVATLLLPDYTNKDVSEEYA